MNSTSFSLTDQSLIDFQTDAALTVQQIGRLLKVERPVILEIGANCGQTTIEFLEVFPDARIYCFEPDPRAIEKFKRNIDSPNVELVEAAVGADSGFVMFHQSSGAEWIDPSGWDHSGSIRKPKTHLEVWPWVKFEKQIPVRMIKLDDWVTDRKIERVDFIWADVQGAESDLILGALQTLSKTDYFYTEFSDDEWYEGQINFQLLSSLLSNFSLVHKFNSDALFRRR
jgi:FkbM family methyltransferase